MKFKAQTIKQRNQTQKHEIQHLQNNTNQLKKGFLQTIKIKKNGEGLTSQILTLD
jgi:hypothetical protein